MDHGVSGVSDDNSTLTDTANDATQEAPISLTEIDEQAQPRSSSLYRPGGDITPSSDPSPTTTEDRSNLINEVTGKSQDLTGYATPNAVQLDESGTYSLIDNPPNLARIRQIMFECKEPIEISLQEFETYWPFIDNVYVKQRSNSSKEGHCTTDYLSCRLRRKQGTNRSSGTRLLPEGKRPRKRKIREGGLCNFQIKVIRFEGAYSTVTIAKTPGSSHEHSHDLLYIDKIKRPSGLMEFVRREASKGYLPSSIYMKFREEPEKLIEAGGRFLQITDVRNASAHWRLQNPEVDLVPHEGYEYQKGRGIVRARNIAEKNNTTADRAVPRASTLPPLPPDTLPFPQFQLDFLEPYLPKSDERRELPHVTLSYASSMDSKISLLPGMQTVLSGPEAKLMTHYLRSRHDAILIGVGTVLADNPGLNCRLQGAGGFGGLGRMWQPRPVIIDPTGRWSPGADSRLLRTAVEGKGRAPWVVVSPGAQIHPSKLLMLKGYGGEFLRIMEYHQNWRLRWESIFRALASEGIKSVMIEGGGRVLSELLNPEYAEFIDSLVVTLAPTYLGSGGVGVSPDSKSDAQGKPNAALNPRAQTGYVSWLNAGNQSASLGRLLLDEAMAARRHLDLFSASTRQGITISFLLYGCQIGMGNQRQAYYFLREATTLYTAGMLDPADADDEDAGNLFWLLLISERAHAIRRHRPITLQVTRDSPILCDTRSDAFSLGFRCLAELYRPFDQTFLSRWNGTDSSATTEQLIQLEDHLLQAVPADVELPDIVLADLRVSQQWLRTMIWQLATSAGFLSSTPSRPCLGFAYPLQIARDLSLATWKLSKESLETHGIGLAEKIFEITCTLTDVMACMTSAGLRSSSFDLGPQDYLKHLCTLIHSLPGGETKFLPLLLAKISQTLPSMLTPVTRHLSLPSCMAEQVSVSPNVGIGSPVSHRDDWSKALNWAEMSRIGDRTPEARRGA